MGYRLQLSSCVSGSYDVWHQMANSSTPQDTMVTSQRHLDQLNNKLDTNLRVSGSNNAWHEVTTAQFLDITRHYGDTQVTPDGKTKTSCHAFIPKRKCFGTLSTSDLGSQ